MNILLTSGAGYIGSHTYVSLVEAGFVPIVLDSFSNSHLIALDRLARIGGKPVICEHGDVCSVELVDEVIRRYQINAVIHFAAFKSVGESVSAPLRYYRNNLVGLISVLEAMEGSR